MTKIRIFLLVSATFFFVVSFALTVFLIHVGAIDITKKLIEETAGFKRFIFLANLWKGPVFSFITGAFLLRSAGG